MSKELRLRKIADIRDGISGEGQPAWYEVEGLPNDQQAFVESEGRPTNRWRLRRIPAADKDKTRTFESPEEALTTLQQELN